jgi:hypothetical protein
VVKVVVGAVVHVHSWSIGQPDNPICRRLRRRGFLPLS